MKKWMPLIVVALSIFIVVIDTTIMNVSISDLVEDLNTTIVGIQAAISLYALVMASLMLIGGKLANIIGKKRTFLIGLVIYGLGTTLASFSNSLTILLVGWSFLEGVGAALMLPNLQVILRTEYDGSDRALAYGVFGAMGAIGAAIGPIVGGFLTTYYSWRWAFRLEVLIVIIVLALSSQIETDKVLAKRPKFDLLGAMLSISGLSTIVLGILLIQNYGLWSAKQPFVIGSLKIAPFGLSIVPFMVGFGILLIMLLFRWEQRLEDTGGDGLFEPSLLKIKGLKSSLAVRFIQVGTIAGFLFVVPLLLQMTFEYTAMQTGMALIPLSLGILIFALIGAKLSARFRAKHIIQVGFLLSLAGLIVMALTIQPDARPVDLSTGALFGIGMGLIASQIINLILSSVEEKDTPVAAGVATTFEQLGNSIGVALLGTMMLVTLTTGVQQSITASATIPEKNKTELTKAIDTSVELVSDTQLENELKKAEADPALEEEIRVIYKTNRTQAFQISMVFLAFITLVGLILTTGLPDQKLVNK